MKIAESDIVISHIVHDLSCELITKQSRIALDKRVESLLRNQVHGDFFNLLRRASVKG